MKDAAESVIIEPFNPEKHSVELLTTLLHESYAELYKKGMHFYAATQDAQATLRRLTKGKSLIALLDGAIVGTITYYANDTGSKCEWYTRPNVGYFGQFAVHPKYQKLGIGKKMLIIVEQMAKDEGKKELALDTSEHAEELIAYYTKNGFTWVEYTQWDKTNYRSVVMSKSLD